METMNQNNLNCDHTYSVDNPLDFLLIDEYTAKRGTRSSMESSDRQLEIPECRPPYISSRRDSNRSRGFLDLYSS